MGSSAAISSPGSRISAIAIMMRRRHARELVRMARENAFWLRQLRPVEHGGVLFLRRSAALSEHVRPALVQLRTRSSPGSAPSSAPGKIMAILSPRSTQLRRVKAMADWYRPGNLARADMHVVWQQTHHRERDHRLAGA